MKTNYTEQMQLVVLIACVSLKKKERAKAKELYNSQLFIRSLAYAEKLKPDQIFILSALHGLLDLETEIEPYDVTLSYVPQAKRKPGLIVLNSKEKRDWGKKVIEQLSQKASLQQDAFVVLAGQEYIKPIKASIVTLENPLKGLSQGKRLSFLKANN